MTSSNDPLSSPDVSVTAVLREMHFSDREPAARRAASLHYSLFVTMMKGLLAGIAVVVLVLVMVWPKLSGLEDHFHLSFSNVVGKDVESLSMVNARYSGVNDNDEPFTVTADLATETGRRGSGAYDLEAPKADMTMESGAGVVINSNTGHYDRDHDRLDLQGDVNLYHDDGYEMHTASARINIKDGSANGNDCVHGQGPFGRIESQGFQLWDDGQHIQFGGKAKLVLDSGRKRKAP
ncbi:MAG: LPS export ABC transporter periplasmic protein LptC [Alphaproteobacteria bacterium]|nr:LPS export ABC transporter periplasmic protein LptC [Alphaproteobacteria bacterium]